MNSNPTHEIAVVGLGVMGANLARNFAGTGRRTLGFDLNPDAGERLRADTGIEVASDWKTLVARLEHPRRIVLLVPAGAPVDSVLDALDPLLEQGDVIVDAGNSYWRNTEARIQRAASRPWNHVGMGVSGGAEGALKGPSMMPGGEREAWETLQPLLEGIAAKSVHGPCVTYCGSGAAGHFVKMVHNGIEYGDMQLIAESATLLRGGLGLSGLEASETFARWNEGELDSFLIEITADILRTPDPEASDGSLLVDAILDRAGQKGTGTWTAQAALELGVACPTIVAAVEARVQSSQKELRVEAEEHFKAAAAALEGVTAGDIEQALFCAKVASYTQGFALLQAASEEHGFGIDRAEVARIWTAGCIIRARLLERVMQVFKADAPPLLAFAFQGEISARLPAWRRVVAAAATAGIPVPGLSASLAWFDSLVTARGSASLIQAQRDYFGSHTYERLDRPGEKVHTDWDANQR